MSDVRLAQPKFLLLFLLTALFGVLAFGWGRAGLSDQEMVANYAKAMDYARGFREVGNWPWWTPFFNSGQSQAPALGTFFAYLPLLLFSPMGVLTGCKTAVFVFGAASSLAMFAFAKALTRSEWTALVCAFLYVLCPQFALRAGWNEHLVVVFCFPYPPLMCWALLCLSRRPSHGAVLVLGVATAAMFLTYAKIAVVFMPAFLMFALWLSVSGRSRSVVFWRGIMQAVVIFIPLGALPLLPSLREKNGLALFDFDPLEAWQHSFAVHTPLSFFDREGWLLQGLPPGMAVDKAGTYVGILLIAGLAWLLWRRKDWSRRHPEAAFLRVFMGMALLLFWFSLGPRCLLLQHWNLLENAQGLKDWVIPLLWLALFLPGFLISSFWPWPRNRISLILLIGVTAGLYLVPGFAIFENISQIHDIRAPWSFWQVGGSFAIAMLGGLVLAPLFHTLKTQRARIGLGLVLTALVLWDASAYEKEFFKHGLTPEVAENFRKGQQYLASSPHAGSVLPVSGRYFYLMIPEMSGRPLVMEAFQSYLMPRYTKRLMEATAGSPDLLSAYMKVAGVGFVWIDKKDPELGPAAESFFRGLLSVADENDDFLILENSPSLAPAYFSGEITLVPSTEGTEKEILSKAQSRNFLAVSIDSEIEAKDFPGLVGQVNLAIGGKTVLQIKEGSSHEKGPTFLRLTDVQSRTNPHRIALTATLDKPGWITVPESFHRDWRAELNGKPVTVYRGMGAFLSVPVASGVQRLNFFFNPPIWYWLCAWIASLAWGMVGILISGLVFSGSVRNKLFGRDDIGSDVVLGRSVRIRTTDHEKASIRKALVVVPCYNEAVAVAETLRQILKHALVEVLVVDDASPDGTAAIVKAFPEFGSRVHLLLRSGKQGLASAYKEGFAWALRKDYDAVLEIDADLSHDPADIPRLIGALDEGADLAVGSRYLDGGRVLNWSKHRLFLSVFAGTYTRWITSLPMTDPTSGFKAIRREVLEALDWKTFEAEGYGFQIELHVRAWRLDFKIKEVPIVFTERRSGASKMSRQIAWEAARRVVQLAMEKGGGGIS